MKIKEKIKVESVILELDMFELESIVKMLYNQKTSINKNTYDSRIRNAIKEKYDELKSNEVIK